MPAEAELDKLGVKNAEKMIKESNDWEVALGSLIAAHFKTVGIEINSATDTFSSGASDNDIQQVIEQVQEKYNSLSRQLAKKPREISKGAYTLGDQVAMLPCAANSDVLVVIRGAGVIPTLGRSEMAALAGGALAQSAIVTVTLADAKSGEILSMIRFRNDNNFLNDAEGGFGDPLNEGLFDLNLGNARKLEREGKLLPPP